MVLASSLLILVVTFSPAISGTILTVEEEFIADYLDAFGNIYPTFLVRTDLPQFAEFGVFPKKALYSCIYYEERDIEALATRIVSLIAQKQYLYGHNAVFFIGKGHDPIIQVSNFLELRYLNSCLCERNN